MGYRMLLPLVLVVIGWLLCFAVKADNIVYRVVPYTLGSQNGDEYLLAGTITTDGTLGYLDSSNIVDYEITVAGSVPYTFLPANPNAEVIVPEYVLEAFGVGLYIEIGEEISFSAEDNSSPQCSSCGQEIAIGVTFPDFFAAPVSYRIYRHDDSVDEEPNIGHVVGSGPWNEAFAVVPEPSTQLLGAVCCVVVFLSYGFRIKRTRFMRGDDRCSGCVATFGRACDHFRPVGDQSRL